MNTTDHDDNALAQWLLSPFGRYVRAWEMDFFQHKTDAIQSGVLVQMGLPQWPLISHARQGVYTACQHVNTQSGSVHVCALPHALPWPDSSVDALLWPHGLDVCTQPMWVLAEIHRVLVPQGKLILSGLNPAGYWRLHDRQLAGALNLYRVHQLRPIMLNHGFVIDEGQFMAYAWPWWLPKAGAHKNRAIEHMGNRWWPHLSAVYGLVVRKEVLGMRLSERLEHKQQQEKDLQLVGAGYGGLGASRDTQAKAAKQPSLR